MNWSRLIALAVMFVILLATTIGAAALIVLLIDTGFLLSGL